MGSSRIDWCPAVLCLLLSYVSSRFIAKKKGGVRAISPPKGPSQFALLLAPPPPSAAAHPEHPGSCVCKLCWSNYRSGGRWGEGERRRGGEEGRREGEGKGLLSQPLPSSTLPCDKRFVRHTALTRIHVTDKLTIGLLCFERRSAYRNQHLYTTVVSSCDRNGSL